jgi:hypothetical protein
MGTGHPRPPLRPEVGEGTWGLLRRPLDLFRLEPGSDCPRSYARPAHTLSNQLGAAAPLGEGPVYPVVTTGPEDRGRETAPHRRPYGVGRLEGGWYYLKTLWVERPRYRGPALVRGRQLDGPRLVRFGAGPRPTTELRLWNPSGGFGRGWLERASYLRLRGPGCYGLQVDGKSFGKTMCSTPASARIPARSAPSAKIRTFPHARSASSPMRPRTAPSIVLANKTVGKAQWL